MAVEISGVTLRPGDDLITAARLDYPRTGPIDGYALEVFGWVVTPRPVAELEFVHDGNIIATCELSVSRPDVARKFGGSSQVGFWKAIGTVGLQPDFTIGVRVVFEDGRRAPIAEIRGTQQLTSSFTPSIQPITLTHPGRCGSTRLMRTLSEHPDIVVEERFPYETYVFAYWLHFIQVMAAPADTSRVESWQFSKDLKRLPPFAYYLKDPAIGRSSPEQATLDRWYATDQVDELIRVAQAAVESFYLEYASSRKNTRPPFFAEKIVPTGRYRWIRRQLYPEGREIFLFRDPRDHLASVMAFFPGDRRLVETDEQYVELIRKRLQSLLQTWKSTPRYSTLVRYEDLVLSPTEQLRSMLDALELDSSTKIINSMIKAGDETTANVNAHQTSANSRSSISRWKQDLEPRMQKICNEVFEELLDELGYE